VQFKTYEGIISAEVKAAPVYNDVKTGRASDCADFKPSLFALSKFRML
jgi:hypothetical protein